MIVRFVFNTLFHLQSFASSSIFCFDLSLESSIVALV